MSPVKDLAKRALRLIAEPVLRRLAARVGAIMARANPQGTPEKIKFELGVIAALRSLTTRGDYRVLLPHDSAREPRDPKEMKIGFFGNIANNAYNFTKCLRRLGYDTELVLEDGFFDVFLMNRPFWEDLEVACSSYEDGLASEHRWGQPVYVRRVAFNPELQARFQGRYSAIPEVQVLYKEAFGADLPPDVALLLAQQMGHWPYLLAMKRYDVIQFSGAAISMGVFCPKPYVVFPTGSDLFISPFQEDAFGMLMRVGYRNARHLLLCESNYPEYLDRLELRAARSFAPLMVDTDTYAPGNSERVRVKWTKQVGGKRFILSVCRQSWEWKGNDRLIHGFRAFMKESQHRDWRLVLMQWGPDVERTTKLVVESGLNDLVVWQQLLSKPLLRKLQQAADLVVDQFVMPGYGTSVLESMAAGRVVLMRPADKTIQAYVEEAPPLLGATHPEDVRAGLEEACNDRLRENRGAESLRWVRRYHGYASVARIYLDAFESAMRTYWSVNA